MFCCQPENWTCSYFVIVKIRFAPRQKRNKIAPIRIKNSRSRDSCIERNRILGTSRISYFSVYCYNFHFINTRLNITLSLILKNMNCEILAPGNWGDQLIQNVRNQYTHKAAAAPPHSACFAAMEEELLSVLYPCSRPLKNARTRTF